MPSHSRLLDLCVDRLVQELMPEALPDESGIEEALPLDDWLGANFPDVVSAENAPRHERVWRWIEDLRPGVKPRALIEIWPRGSGKSTTIELGVVRAGVKLSRRFALYVCGTQEQADLHVASIADHFENIGIQRALNVYGSSKGWRRNQLRTANGFSVAGIGLDTAMRGVKMGQFRPDFLIFDDVDDIADSPKTVAKKLTAIPTKILAAGSVDAAVVFIQNLVHEDSVASQLVSGKAEFLLDRVVSPPEVAVEKLETKKQDRGDGVKVYRIVGGTPTWPAGQSLATCERQISEWGLTAFLREAQQEVEGVEGYFFDADELFVEEFPERWDGYRFCIAFDLAATAGAGDYTVAALCAMAPSKGLFWILDLERGQLSEERVRRLVVRSAVSARSRYGAVIVRIPQDPGQAGKAQARQLAQLLREAGVPDGAIRVVPISGSKVTRAKGLAGKVNSGNARMAPGEWNYIVKQEVRKFREDEEHEFDDIVDALADAYNELDKGRKELRTA